MILRLEWYKDIFKIYFCPNISLIARKVGVLPFLLLALRDAAAVNFFFFFLRLVREIRAVARVFVDCRCRSVRLVVLYPDPFMISVIFAAAFLLKSCPDSPALDFIDSLKLTLLSVTSSMTFIPACKVSFPTALAPLLTYGRIRRKSPSNQDPTPRPL